MMEENKMNEKVGCQLFTYQELENAWNELKGNVENDAENKKYPPANGYDIRNGYDTTEGYDPGHTQWDVNDFSLEEITKELESIDKVITAGDMEVYWCGDDYAESDDHGIFIRDGRIEKVY